MPFSFYAHTKLITITHHILYNHLLYLPLQRSLTCDQKMTSTNYRSTKIAPRIIVQEVERDFIREVSHFVLEEFHRGRLYAPGIFARTHYYIITDIKQLCYVNFISKLYSGRDARSAMQQCECTLVYISVH